ncbi:hypothetical protein [Photobacterium minamisatsumaniensis]|uniref:hypothetical protein n=1 Tax=Photobacterium minamisatsumaniensis TaxID=2910233 RepID=UPI003D0AE7F6
MRKTKIMLLAAIIASPMALANDYGYDYDYGYGYGDSYDDSYTIDGSGNKDAKIDIEVSNSYKKTIDYSGNTDDDLLVMKNVGNTYEVKDVDNSQWDASKDVDIDKEINTYLAESTLYGTVMDTAVTYGGACCKKGQGSTLEVDHVNRMGGAFQSASGINIAGQNVGNNSLVQQTTSTNAALVGSGGAVSPIGGGSY